jgi:hypothetical protein
LSGPLDNGGGDRALALQLSALRKPMVKLILPL